MSRITSSAGRRWLAACVPLLMLAWSSTALYAQSAAPQRVLGREEIVLYGIGLKVEPAFQTVPKDIATIVGTFLQAPSLPGGLPPFGADAEVVGTLRGPSFQSPVELRAKPNTPFNIPALTVPGAHVLENIRLMSGGEVLLRGTPDHVTIDVIEKLLVTQVTARALTAAEIREKGIVFDASNFQAYNFSAAFAIGDSPINVNFPIVLPRLEGATEVTAAGAMLGAIPIASMPTLSTIIPDTLKLQAQIPNLSVVGFTLKVPSLNGQRFVVPPIPGVIVIPGDIGFLNQYFSVMLLVGNVAPAGSNLVVTNLKAEIVLPPGNDRVANSSDDPLRMAQTAGGESPRIQVVAQPGPDAKVGTADDVPSIGPGESGNAEYLVEGRREGSHVVEMQITGTLQGLPIGPVTVTGRAAGSVLVRNPKFTLTFTHPEVVSAGEPYTLDVTVTNTSTAPANFVSVNLYPRNVSGATIVGDPSRTIDSLVPGDSTTVSFNLLSKKSGKVTAATLDSDENVAGRFSLKAAVGELGVPLSPDSLVLPKEANGLRMPGDNPDDLKQAALGLLGKAHAVATAPAAALPADVRRFSRKIVIDRAIQVAEAGLRVTMNEPLPVSASQLLMDFMGSDVSRLPTLFPSAADQDFERNNIEGFDELRRRSVRGDEFAAAAGRAMAPALTSQGGQAYLYGLAQAWSYRPNHVSVLVTGNGQPLPARFILGDAAGRRTGAAGPDNKIVKEIPFSDVVDFTNASGLVVARLIVLAAPQPGAYQVTAEPGAGAPVNAGYIVSIVAPDGSGALRQATTPTISFPQRPAAIGQAGDPFVFSFGEFGGETIPGAQVSQVVDPGPAVISVIQQAQADVIKCEEDEGAPAAGRIVAVLFSEEVTAQSVQDRLAAGDITAFSVEGNRVVGVALQPGRRVAFLALRDPFGPFVPRQITITGVTDMRGNTMSPFTGPMQATVSDEAAVVSGRVLNADGTPVPLANVRLFALLTCGEEMSVVGISSKTADSAGQYQFDYVTKKLSARILAINQETGESRAVRFDVQRNGQRLNVDIVFLGRGTFAGKTFDERGTPLAGTALRITSLTDASEYGATTDAAGGFSVPGVPVGNFFVEAVNVAARAEFSFAEYMPRASSTVSRDITLLDVATRDITLKHGSLSGFVLRADGVTPAADVPVSVWYRNRSQPGVPCPGTPEAAECPIAMVTTDGQGAFAFPKLAAGELRLETFDQWALSQGQARVILAADGAATANILLSGGLGTVNGIVRDAAQNPVAGARVGGGLSLTTTGADGRFSLVDVPVGRHAIVAVSDALGSRGETSVDILQAGQVVNAAITLAPAGSVSGTVVLADGVSPVPNVDVYIFENLGSSVSIVGTARTDASGGFRSGAIPAGNYFVSAFNAGFTDGNIVPVTLKFQGQVFRTTIRFRGAGGKIVGKVFDNDGQTPLKATVGVSGDQLVVAGGRVGVEFVRVNYFQVVETDLSTGAFALNNLWVGNVTVSAIGQFSPDPVSVEAAVPAANSTSTVNLQLQSTAQIRGVVLLPNGVQNAGANVIVKYKSDAFKVVCTGSGDTQQCESIPQGIQEENVVTDAQGHFWVPVVNAGTFTLTVEDPATGKLGTIKGNVKPGEIANMSVRLLGTGDVTVKVLGSNGVTPIPGARVEVQQLGFPQKSFTLIADATGTLQLTGGDALVEGAFVVVATDRSNGFTGRANGKVVADGEALVVKVFLYNAAGTVSGTVFAPDGFSPVANADVILSGVTGPLSFGVTDGTGHYSVSSVPVGAVTIDVFEARTGRRGAAAGRVDADGQQVTINVLEGAIGLVKGQILNQNTLQPLRGWSVGLSQQSSSGLSLPQLQTTSGVDGAYSFPGASRGTFTVHTANSDVNAAGSARGALDREGQVVDVPVLVNIVRRLSGKIVGTVVDATGAPAANASLEFCLPDRCGPGSTLQTTAAADGSFAVSDVFLGRFSVVARSQTTGDAGSAVGEVAFDGEVASVTVVLSGLARITGQVVRADGSAAGDVQISLRAYPSSGCAEDCSQSTDGSGHFTFLNVPGRTFTVTAADTATGLKGIAGGSLNPGEQKTLRIVLEPTVALGGRVMRSSGVPAHGAVAELSFSNNGDPERRLYRETGQDGTFDFSAVPLTQYTLVVTDPLGTGIATRQGTLAAPLALGDIVLDEAPPQVASLTPAPASRGAALKSDVVITFTEPVQPGTINPANVSLLGPAGPVQATLDLTSNDTVVVLHPLADLKDETAYTVRIDAVKDRVQKVMPSAYVATFTTVDVTRPAVIEASPAASSRGVTIYTPIRLKFSEPIDPAKFNGAPISLTGPGGPVAGATAYLFGNTVLVFTPNLPLAEGAAYQVSVKKATDLAGLEQATALSYAFSTTSRVPPTLSSLVAENNGRVIEGGVGRAVATPGPDSDVAVVDFYVNGTLAGADRTAPFELAFQATPALGAPGAIVTVTAIPTDTSGNRGVVPAAAQFTIVADQPPTMTLAVTTPSGTLAAQNGDRIVVSLRATDDVGVAQLGYRAVTGNPVDAQNRFYAPAPLDQSESFAFHIPAGAAPGSTVAVQGSAIDSKGQVVQATPVEITVLDAVLPAVQITGATTGATLRPGQSTTVLVTADDLGGINQVTFTAGGLVTRTESRPVTPAQNAVVTSFTVTVPVTAQPGETLTLDATATDRAGNVGTAARVILPIADGLAPTASIHTATGSLSVAPGQTVNVIVGGEDEGLLSELRLAASGSLVLNDAKQVTPPRGSATSTFELLIPAGMAIGSQIQLTATAVDLSGNVSAPATLTLTAVSTIDVTLPASLILKAGKSVDVTVQLGQPAPAGGIRIDLATDHAGVAVAVSSVTFGAGESSKVASVSGIAAGTTTLRARYQGVERAAMTIAVSGGNVSGVVLDSQLRPVAGAQLTVTGGISVSATSGADGTYVAEGLQGPAVTVKAIDPVTHLRGYAAGTMNAAGGSIALTVVLIPAGAVEGTVFLADGTTPAGANVRVDMFDTSRRVLGTTFTNGEGQYAFPLVTLGQYSVEATAADGSRGSAPLTLFESGQEVTLPIVYLGFGTLSGTVRNGANAPVPNAALTLRTWDVFGSMAPILANADQLGHFSFAHVPVGSFSLEARDQGTGQAGSSAGAIVQHQQVVVQDVVIASFGSIHGTVFRADGSTPVAGAQVTTGGRLSITGADGQYRFDILPLGSYALRATEVATRSVGGASAVLSSNGQDALVNIAFAPQGRLLVTVRDANGAPVPSAFVRVTINGSLDEIDATTGADGTALIDHVLSGTVLVVARSGQLVGQVSNITVPAGALVNVTVTLQATGQVTGTVYEPDGQTPATTGTVRLTTTDSRIAVIGADGTYRFESVPMGSYSPVVFDANNRLRAVSKTPVTLAANGQVITRNFTMVGMASVSGRVVFSDGASASNFPVTLRSMSPDFGSVVGVDTDAAGNYLVTGVPMGAFAVSAADPIRQLLGEAAGAITVHGKDEVADIVLQNNAITLPRTLYDGNAFDFTVRRDGQFSTNPSFGSQSSGFGNTPGGSILEIVAGGVTKTFQGDPISTIEDAQREVATRESGLHGLNVTRKIAVPIDGYFSRELELLTNPGTTPITVDVRITSRLRSGNPLTNIVATSSGDTTFSAAAPNPDGWVVFREGRIGNTFLPGRAFVVGSGGTVGLGIAQVAGSVDPVTLTYGWTSLTVQPQQTVGLLHFIAQQTSNAAAQASAERLVQLPPEALQGLSAQELGQIVNFQVPADGHSALAPLPGLRGTITGRVFDGDTPATPTPSAAVTLESSSVLYHRSFGVTAGSDGRFSFTTITADSGKRLISQEPFTLRAEYPRTSAISPNVPGDFPAGSALSATDVVFSNTGVITGTVRRANGTAVLSGTVEISGGTFQRFSVTIPNGAQFRFAGLPPATYTLKAFVSTPQNGQLTASAQVPVTAGATASGDMTLPPTFVVSGSVLRPSGAAVPGVFVRLQGPTAMGVNTSTGGAFSFTDVPAGSYTLTTQEPATGIQTVESVVVVDAAVTKNLVVAAVGSVSGTVSLPGNVPAVGREVQLAYTRPGGQTGSSYEITDGAGHYRFGSVPASTFTVTVNDTVAHVFGTASGSIQADGQDAVVNITLDVSTVNLPAPFYDANGFNYNVGRDSITNAGVFQNQAAILQINTGNAIERFDGGDLGRSEMDGRQVKLTANVGPFAVTRKIFVPSRGYFSRFVETITNPTQAPLTLEFYLANVITATRFNAPLVKMTSSGDAQISVTGDDATRDRWAVIDDFADIDPFLFSYQAPAVAALWGGAGAARPVDAVDFNSLSQYGIAGLQPRWSGITLQPGESFSIMHFMVTQTSLSAAQASMERLAQLPDEATEGLTAEERAGIRNFVIPPAGSSVLPPLPALNGSVQGHAYAADGTTPLNGVEVLFKSNHPIFARSYMMTTSAATGAGAFAFAGSFSNPNAPKALAIADYTLTGTTADTHAIMTAVGTFQPGQTTSTTDLRLTQVGGVTGILRRGSGAPVPGVTVSDYFGRSQVTGADGRFTFLNYAPGHVTLFSTLPFPAGQFGSDIYASSEYDVVAGATVQGDIVFPPSGSLQGVVTTANGTPVGGAIVYAYTPQGYPYWGSTTDAQGRYRFDELAVGTYRLETTEPRSGRPTTVTIPVAAGGTYTRDLQLIAVGTVTVTVQLPSGLPAANAAVWIDPLRDLNWQRLTMTDAAGRAVITNVPAGTFGIRVSHPLNTELFVFGQATLTGEGENVQATITLPAIGTVTGVLRTAAGQPLAFTTVELLEPVTQRALWYATTEQNGTFTFSGVPAGQAMHLGVEHPLKFRLWRYGPDFTLAADGDIHTEDITRPALAQVNVKVTHPDGTPWSGLSLYTSDSVDTLFRFRNPTDANGQARMSDVPEGRYTVQLFHASDGILLKQLDAVIVAADDQTTLTLPVRIDSAQGQVSGQVFGADGTTPIAGVNVELVNVDDGKVVLNGRAVSDVNGSYRFSSAVFSQGGFRVTASSPWNSSIAVSATGSLATEGEQAVRDFVLPVVIGSITGTVTTPGGDPVPGARIDVGDATATTIAHATTAGAGTYRIDNYIAPVAGFTVSASISGVTQSVQRTLPAQRGTVSADLVLPVRERSVRVRVLAADNATVIPQVMVSVTGLAGASLGSRYTDVNGQVTFQDLWLPLAGITLRADYNNGESVVFRSLDGEFDSSAVNDLVMPVSVARGRVTFADLTAVQFPTVFTTDALGRTRMASTTLAGDFVVLNMAPGVFTLTAQDSDSGLRAKRTAQIGDIAIALVLDVALPATGRISGTLFDHRGNTLEEQYVQLSAEGLGFTRETYTGAGGVFSFENVPEGLASVYASAYVDVEGQNYATAAGTVVAGQSLTLDLHPVATAAVSGTLVRADGSTVNGGYLEISALGGASPSGFYRDDTTTNNSGKFSFATVPLGFVKIVGYDESYREFGVTYLQLAAGGGAGITVTFGTGGATDYSLTDDAGTLIKISSDGSLTNGVPAAEPSTNRPYNFTYSSSFTEGSFCCDYIGGLSLGGRQLSLGPLQVPDLFQTRKIFVPQSGGFVRYLEILENTLAVPVTTTLEVSAPLRPTGSRTSVAVPAAATGNTYVLLTDTFGGRTPTAPVVGHVFAGTGAVPARAAMSAVPVSGSNNSTRYQWSVTVPANGRVILMHFGVLAAPTDTAGAQSRAIALVNLSDPEALAGMTPEEKAAVRNFIISTPPGGGGQ